MAIIDNFSKEELEILVKESTSFRELSRKIGYTSTGSNNYSSDIVGSSPATSATLNYFKRKKG